MSKMTVAHIAAEKEYAHFDLAYPNPTSGKWEIDLINLTAFLVVRGYAIYRTSLDKFIIIQIVNNIVKQVGKKDIIDVLLAYIIKKEESRFLHQFFLKNMAKAVSDDFIITLPEKIVNFKKDKKDAMQIYYRNCILKITGKSLTTHSYTSLDGYIWESQILQRDYIPGQISESDFKTFVWNVSNHQEPRFHSICSVLGFLIHNYKSPAYCPAIILNDEVISDNPEGGTGKGILLKAIEQFLTTVTIEGKTFSFDKNFVYQAVNSDTKLLSFQDVNKNFDFERLFSVMTDGINVEKKGMQSVHYNFADTPKVAITTNYAIKGAGNSNERRRFELEISQYYNKQRTPLQEFSKMFFVEWTPEDFAKFDSFMADCCQFYLINGLIEQELINLPEKRLRGDTNSDFLEWMEDFTWCYEIGKKEILDRFVSAYPKYRTSEWLTVNFFGKWISKYCEYHKIALDSSGRDKAGVMRVYKFNNFPIKQDVF